MQGMTPEVFIPPHNTIAPETIAWFPPSILLTSLIILVCALIIYFCFAVFKYRQHLQLSLRAQKELHALFDKNAGLLAANNVLKRLAIAYYGEAIKPLNGQAWADFLLTSMGQKHHAMRETVALLSSVIYYKDIPYNQALHNACLAWTKDGIPKYSWLRCRPIQSNEVSHV